MEILDSLFPVRVPITFPVVIFLTSPLLTAWIGENAVALLTKGTVREARGLTSRINCRRGLHDIILREGEGSRVVFELNGIRRYFHRPHPGKEAKKYQVEELREWFKYLEVIP